MMAKIITIFTIVSGFASILGFVFVFFSDATSPIYRVLCVLGFGAAFFWSAYVLFVPGTSVETNVAGKIAYYRVAAAEKQSDMLIIQRGEVSFSGFGPISIEFPLPFRDVPDIEVINSGGYSDEYVPFVEKRTAHQVIFRRTSVGGSFTPEAMQIYRWVARGVPLDEITSKM
jgi:hypothetical protein